MKKVLIITYYWPPAGGPGVQRWLKFVKYLPEFGVQPIVFIPENPTYPIQDNSLLEEIPEGIQIIKQRIFEPYALSSFLSKKKTKRISSGIIQKHKKQSILERIMLWVRGNLFIPDARKYWVKPSVKTISKLLLDEKIDSIITTGPPHSVHLIGHELKRKLGIKWLADLRDPWTSIGYHKQLKLSAASSKKHKILESTVLNGADAITVTSEITKQEFEKITDRPIKVITNGFDGNRVSTKLDAKFALSHIGSLLTDRNPIVLWEVLQQLVSENEKLKISLKIQLVGVVGDGVKESIQFHGLDDYIEEVGYVSHEKVQEYQTASQILLLLEVDSVETQGIIPGKLFEYFRARRPILAIGPEQWEGGKLVEKHEAGQYFRPDDKEALKQQISHWFNNFENGALHCNSKGIEQYHRRELTKQLANLLSWE
ncbi:glycosyltransferase family 4 protein [Croceivirga thetidis]|uniref:Glycosyltransferase family 4 protein n=1 Tax=Croceivirga thetidis TaxID=2721623 RepID=A0ABX1GQE0_9FLAO|nr:glycosyltransferase family 4 protein [Croceivirga thetidis]NKI32143.1 glycosyltransferase family 4 protein [Croceivirga thetidis]